MALPENIINPGQIVPRVAGAALSKNMCVKAHTTEGQVVKTAADTDIGVGFVQEAATAAGQGVSVAISGIVWAIAAGAIALTDICVPDTTVDGSVKAGATGDRPIGIPLAAAADTELFPILITHGTNLIA